MSYKNLAKRLKAAFMLIALVTAQVVIPAHRAFAAEETLLQPTWCQLIGQNWEAKVSATRDSNDNPLVGPLDGYAASESADATTGVVVGQILAQNRTEALDVACTSQHDPTTPTPDTPAADTQTPGTVQVVADTVLTPETPTIVDTCGTENDNVTLPVTTLHIKYSMVRTGQVVSVTAEAEDGFTLEAANGFTLNADGTATLVINLDDTSCPLTIAPCRAIEGPVTVTTANQFASWQDTRSAGHYEFTEGGLRIWTDNDSSNAKVAWYHNVDYALSTIGEPAMNFTQTSGTIAPGMQIKVDFNNDGTTDGTLVGESVYGDNWWLTDGSAQFVKDNAPHIGGGNGSQWYGTLDEWLTNFPNAQVKSVGFSLGSGVHASGVLQSLTFGCVQWVFTTAEEVVPAEPIKVDLCYTDLDYVVLPAEQEGVIYKVNGEVVSGAYAVNGASSVTVTAEATEGYVMAPEAQTSWTFSFTDQQCLTISKKAQTPTDTNGDGKVGVGDTITWDITIKNEADTEFDLSFFNTFYGILEDENGTFVEVDTPEGILEPGDSYTLHATTVITASDVVACKASNTATLSAIRNLPILERKAEKQLFDDSDEEDWLVQVSATAEAKLDCVPGRGGSTTPKPVVTTTTYTPSELPYTGPTDSLRGFVISIVAALTTYGVIYFAQNKRRYE